MRRGKIDTRNRAQNGDQVRKLRRRAELRKNVRPDSVRGENTGGEPRKFLRKMTRIMRNDDAALLRFLPERADIIG